MSASLTRSRDCCCRRRRRRDAPGRTIYEWEQTIEEVSVYIRTPPGARAADLDVRIGASSLSVGIKGNPNPYLQHDTFAPVVTGDSTWTLDGTELCITLAKARQGEPWTAVFAGHEGTMSGAAEQAERKRLLLERFQAEHPGFDFSGAEMSGEAPDAHTFMGGFERQ